MVKNQPNQVIGAQLTNVSTGADYVGPVTVYVTGDAGTQTLGSVGGGLCQAEGRGYFTYRPAQAETNYGLIAFTFTAPGAITATIQVATVTAASAAAATGATGLLAGTVRALISDALNEIGVLEAGETMTADQASIGLRRVQSMIDSWAADRLTLSLQKRTPFTWPASTSTVQIGPGQTCDMERPVWLNTVSYVIPGSSPEVEVPVGILDQDNFAALSIKALVSALPTQCFYQTNRDDGNGTLFVWPQIPAGVTLVLYTPQATAVPATLNSVIQGPPGYADAFLYQLALRLCGPFGVSVPPLLPRLASGAFEAMKKPNVSPGVLSVDAALVPGLGAGFNVLTGQISVNH